MSLGGDVLEIYFDFWMIVIGVGVFLFGLAVAKSLDWWDDNR